MSGYSQIDFCPIHLWAFGHCNWIFSIFPLNSRFPHLELYFPHSLPYLSINPGNWCIYSISNFLFLYFNWNHLFQQSCLSYLCHLQYELFVHQVDLTQPHMILQNYLQQGGLHLLHLRKYNYKEYGTGWAPLDILFCQITTFIKVCATFVFGLQTF